MPSTLTTAHESPTLKQRIDGGYDCDEIVYNIGDLAAMNTQLAALPTTKDFGGVTFTRVGFEGIETSKPSVGSISCVVKYATATPTRTISGKSISWVTETSDSEAQRLIRTHPTYKTCWEYHLASKQGASAYGAFATATDPSLSDADALLYRWIRDPAELPVDAAGLWAIQSGHKKILPGQESFITDSIEINAYRIDVTDLIAATSTQDFLSGVRLQPSAYGINWLGYPDSAANWLCAGSSVKQDGWLWRASVRLLFSAEGWSTTVYPDVITPA
jgi:hypothetical protein